MGEFSKCFVQHDITADVINHLKGYFAFRREETLDDEYQFWPDEWDDRQDVFVVSPAWHKGWTELDIRFWRRQYSEYDYDAWFKQASLDLNTKILYGYYQSTAGDSRVAAFSNGTMEISVCHKNEGGDALTLKDNTGLNTSLAAVLKLPLNIGDPVYGNSIMDHPVIYDFFTRSGMDGEPRPKEDIPYTHLERR